MKKRIQYIECYCDRCQKKAKQIYGQSDNYFSIEMENVTSSQIEECRISPNYFLRRDGIVRASYQDSGICLACFKVVLKQAFAKIEAIEANEEEQEAS